MTPTRPLARVAALLPLGLVLFGLWSPSEAQPMHRSDLHSAAAAGSLIEHRVVWDDYRAGRPGIHLRSAETDGADEKPIYRTARGFTLELSEDRAGRQVAFATCCSDALPALVVVPVDGGRSQRPLAHHRRIFTVSGIGWSPDGRRLAFEGTVAAAHRTVTSLWTVRPNGRDLQHVLTLPRGRQDQPVINPSLAWTGRGIVYGDGHDLRVVRPGRSRSRLFLRHAYSARLSGDGHHLMTERLAGRRDVFVVSTASGGHPHHVLTQATDPATEDFYDQVTSNADGSALLAFRMVPGAKGQPEHDQVVTWAADQSVSSATVLDFAGGNNPVTWN